MTKNIPIDQRASILLSLQRALLGEVFPSLRGVTVGVEAASLKIVCYVGEPLTADDMESLSSVETEVMADISVSWNVQLETIECKETQRLTCLDCWVYLRKENRDGQVT